MASGQAVGAKASQISWESREGWIRKCQGRFTASSGNRIDTATVSFENTIFLVLNFNQSFVDNNQPEYHSNILEYSINWKLFFTLLYKNFKIKLVLISFAITFDNGSNNTNMYIRNKIKSNRSHIPRVETANDKTSTASIKLKPAIERRKILDIRYIHPRICIRFDQPSSPNVFQNVSIPTYLESFAPFSLRCNDVTSLLGARVPNERASWKGEERSSRSFRSGNSVDDARVIYRISWQPCTASGRCNCATPFFHPLETRPGLVWTRPISFSLFNELHHVLLQGQQLDISFWPSLRVVYNPSGSLWSRKDNRAYAKGVVGIMARKLSWRLDFYCVGIEGGVLWILSVDWIF